MMGSIYLCYSAYFLSADFENISEFMKFIMASLYLYHGISNSQSLRYCLDKISDFEEETEGVNPHDLSLESLCLKQKLLRYSINYKL
jgi:hypothetical protein